MTDLPHPWNAFLAELDECLTEPVALHCLGGFVATYYYGLSRRTGDIDYYTSVPDTSDFTKLAGEGSPLAAKFGVALHCVPLVTLPENYESRLIDMTPGRYQHLRLMVLDPYDLILSKLERNSTKDRDDADYIFRAKRLSSAALRARYEQELRPYLVRETSHDLTLKLWIEIFESG